MLGRLITVRRIAWLSIAALNVEAAEAIERMPLVSGPELPLPSVWRVLIVFLLVGAMAFAATLLLRKFKPWLIQKGITSTTDIAVISQRKVARGLNVYVITVEKQNYMIVHSPHSTVVSRMDTSAECVEPKSDIAIRQSVS